MRIILEDVSEDFLRSLLTTQQHSSSPAQSQSNVSDAELADLANQTYQAPNTTSKNASEDFVQSLLTRAAPQQPSQTPGEDNVQDISQTTSSNTSLEDKVNDLSDCIANVVSSDSFTSQYGTISPDVDGVLQNVANVVKLLTIDNTKVSHDDDGNQIYINRLTGKKVPGDTMDTFNNMFDKIKLLDKSECNSDNAKSDEQSSA